MGAAEGVAKITVQRWFSLFGINAHLAQTFKPSQIFRNHLQNPSRRDILEGSAPPRGCGADVN
ncbi:MAG: hypothetical protein OXT71_10705, partial [Acidobacteriota bacterium]|nr:hypothetical protein [Acidobacteriota bacterium]